MLTSGDPRPLQTDSAAWPGGEDAPSTFLALCHVQPVETVQWAKARGAVLVVEEILRNCPSLISRCPLPLSIEGAVCIAMGRNPIFGSKIGETM